MMIIVIATMFCNSRHWPWVSIMREATKDMLPLPVTPWQGNTLTRWHGDTTPAPRHGVGSRLDSCVAHQDGNPKPPSNPTAFKVRNLRKPSAVRNHICLKTTYGIHNKKKCVLKRFCHPGSKDIVADPSTQNLLSAAHLPFIDDLSLGTWNIKVLIVSHGFNLPVTNCNADRFFYVDTV